MGDDVGGVVADVGAGAEILVGAGWFVSIIFKGIGRRERRGAYLAGATSSTQCPNVPNVTLE